MPDITTEHILSYFHGELSPEKQNIISEKIEKSSDFKKEVEDLYFIWRTTGELNMQRKINTDKYWEKVSRKIVFFKLRKKIWNNIKTSAAIFIIPVMFISYFLSNTNKTQSFPLSEETMQTITSAYGLISKVALDDGSEVWLNSGSTLSYPLSFKSKRRIKLNGEAYFKVKSDASNRFEVEMENGLIVGAYGTQFNIRAYSDEQFIETSLVEGNVMLSLPGKRISNSVHLKKNQRGILNTGSDRLDISEVNTSLITAWKDGKMIFRRTGMEEVVKRLSRRFNVEIKLKDEILYEYEYNATFTNESLDDILELLKKSSPICYKIVNSKQLEDGSFTKRQIIISKIKNSKIKNVMKKPP